MGKIKKPVKIDKRASKSPNVIGKNKSRKNKENTSPGSKSLQTPKKPLSVNKKQNLLKKNKKQDLVSEDGVQQIAKQKNSNQKREIEENQQVENGTNKLNKKTKTDLNENKIKKTFKVKSKTFKIKTGAIFHAKQKKTAQANDESNLHLEGDTIRSGIKALFQIVNETKNNKSLFDEESPIFLQFSSVKIGKTPSHTLRIPLQHSLLKDSSDICLITDDGRGHIKKEYEKTIEYYENLLRDKNIKNIKTILPLYQLKAEYSEFELKRKLLELYDIFLVDAKVSGYVVKELGKIFRDKRKLPIPVRLNAINLKEYIDFALRKTSTNLHPHGDNFVVQVGHMEMNENEVFENIEVTCKNLAKNFPGGWENIRALHIKTPSSTSIPIYSNFRNASELSTPVVKAKRPKAFKVVSGELSTAYDKEVEVLPSGEVKFTKIKQVGKKHVAKELKSDAGEAIDDRSNNDDIGRSKPSKIRKMKLKKVQDLRKSESNKTKRAGVSIKSREQIQSRKKKQNKIGKRKSQGKKKLG